jgi:outer membrane receptor protein involved in Fe transport
MYLRSARSLLDPLDGSGCCAFAPNAWMRVFVLAGALGAGVPAAAQTHAPADANAGSAWPDLADLGRIEVVTATLTTTQLRLVPASTTSLNESTVRQSGARTLNELLEIHTPNTQLILHNGHLDHFGIRGILSDREDKYLLRVNGKVMNNRFLVGAESERDLPLLGDFREITLVHGPGSATYGAGALAGVLNLETHTGMTFEGADVQVRQGFSDQFAAGEFRVGRRLGDDAGVFFYAGVAEQRGATQAVAPFVYGRSFVTPGPTADVVAGQPVAFRVPNLRDAGDLTKVKLHFSYVRGPLEVWARYTRGGGVVRPQRSMVQANDPAEVQPWTNQDRQFTAAGTFRAQLSSTWNLDAMLCAETYEHIYTIPDSAPMPLKRREDEAYTRVLGTWSPGPDQSFGIGAEYSHMWFDGARLSIPAVADRWRTDTVSLLAEHQWHPAARWTTFLSGRLDKHTYTRTLFSPRAAVVFTPDDRNTFKLIAAQARRRSGDGELREQHVRTGTAGDTESLRSLELRYEGGAARGWMWAGSAFVESNAAIGYNVATQRSLFLGTFKIWGLEPEVSFQSERTRVTLSHGFTQLAGASLETPGTVQGITARPYGFGHDLANWANHITKLAVVQEWNERWTASTSLRVYWGFPGAQALADWNASRPVPVSYALADPGYEEAYGPSVYWNAGLEYRPTDRLTLRADAFNMLGWLDKTLNKRIYYSRGSDYSSEAAAVSLLVKVGL